MKPLAVVTDFKAVSFREVARVVASVIKKEGVPVKLYSFEVAKIPDHNILFVGNLFHLTISHVQRFLPDHNVVFYAITEGIPVLDSMSKKISQKITYITPSLYAKQCLEEAGLICEAVIQHGISLDEKYDKQFRNYVKQSLPNPTTVEPSNVMLCVAGNWMRKAIDKLMVAYKTVEKITKDAFLILHSGMGDTNVVGIQQLLELKRFWFTNMWGTLEPDKLASLYALCNFYVQPSMVEGFGLTYLEAFRFNKPVIAVNCPATNEIVKNGYTGLLLPVTKTEDVVWQQRHAIRLHYFDVDDLIDSMVFMTDEKARTRIAENIKQEKHRWDQNVLYKDFLKYIV